MMQMFSNVTLPTIIKYSKLHHQDMQIEQEKGLKLQPLYGILVNSFQIGLKRNSVGTSNKSINTTTIATINNTSIKIFPVNMS